ncbi:uncharacterized protein LOC142764751 [Rhipicephalus microplus]|uniref:uncharacterized protein LOC142764751 n=1 Tax=Rhipicephalus microplus TaxID=6941 RepID=UPI003F6A7CC8
MTFGMAAQIRPQELRVFEKHPLVRGCQKPMPDNPGKSLEAPQFTDKQGAPENPEETTHCEGAPASSESNDESFVDGGTPVECSVAAEDDRMNESSSVQEGEMTGGTTNFMSFWS